MQTDKHHILFPFNSVADTDWFLLMKDAEIQARSTNVFTRADMFSDPRPRLTVKLKQTHKRCIWIYASIMKIELINVWS